MENNEKQITEADEKATHNEISVSDDNFSNELNEPRWSVVNFEETKAKNLTYDEAARKLQNLAAEGVSGLCIITDEAAARI